MSSELDFKISNRNKIFDKIQEKKKFIEGTIFKPLLDKISNAKKERNSLLIEFSEKQFQCRYETNPTNLIEIEKELINLCNKLSEIDSKIKELNDELKSIREKSAKTPLTQLEEELNILNNELNHINDDISLLKEQDRKKQIEENKNKKYSGLDLNIGLDLNNNNNYQKVIIDDSFGIYINYPKGDVISNTMNCVFGSGMNTIPDDYQFSKEQVLNNISNLELPGLPTLLNMFIDTLIKSIGQGFVKQFFFFKNTIDLLAGLELGELLGTYIPGLPKIIQDIKTLLTDPETWMFQKMLGPLFDINIPIPEFNIDLGALIPFLPAIIKIPNIDSLGYFNKLTPFNIAADPKDINSDWQKQIVDDCNIDQKSQELKFSEMRIKYINDLDSKIRNLQNDINGYNKYTSLKDKSEKSLQRINIQYEQLKIDVKNHNYDIEKLKNYEIKLSEYCDIIEKENKKLNELILLEKQEQNRLDLLNKDLLNNELLLLMSDRNELKEQPQVSLKEFKKRSLLIAYNQNINDNLLDVKLSNLWNIGINIFNDKVTEYLQKIGYNFKDDKYLEKINSLKSYGFKFNDSTHLERLYSLGFSLNDPNYMKKLQLLKQYNIDIFNTEILFLFIEMGMNFNNNYFSSVIDGLNSLGVNLTDIDVMRKLKTLGFNFNNPKTTERLKILSKYVDITSSIGYNNALTRNVNLNNPYFEEVLKKYNRIGLTWDKNGIENFDKEIKDNVHKEDVIFLLNVINYFINSDGNLDIIKNLYNGNNIENKIFISTDATYLSNSNVSIFSEINLNLPKHGIVSNATKVVGNNYILNEQGEIYSLDLSYYDSVIFNQNSGSTNSGSTNSGSTTYNRISEYTRVYWVSLFDFDINKYAKYGIKIDLTKSNILIQDFYSKPQKNTHNIYDNSGKILKKYVYPNNVPIYSEKNENSVLIIKEKLELMLNFINNDYKWVIDGVNISENYGQVDAQMIVNSMDPSRVPQLIIQEITNGDNQVSYAELRGIYGNFDKLGLNIRDNDFDNKVKVLSKNLKIKADESVMLDVTRKVTMSYYDYKDNDENNRWKTIDLSTTKVDPKFFQNVNYKSNFNITNVIDSSIDPDKIPTKPLVQFNSLSKLGFNFQQYKIYNNEKIETYNDNVNLLLGLKFDMSLFQTSEIVNSLCAIGWHFSSNNYLEKIQKLRDFGFNFFIQSNNSEDSSLEELKFKDMDGKLNSLCNFGFHFEKTEWKTQITEMRNLGISLNNNDFDNIIGELNSFGINLNDIDWKIKLNKLKELGIDFSSVSEFDSETIKAGDKKWVAQMSNFNMLGINFNGNNWLSEFNDAKSFKQLGIDYTNVENRQKIAILVKLGIDFNKPREDYMQKIESLVKLKLITIPDSVEKQKVDYLSDRKNKLIKIQSDIDRLKSILNGDIVINLDSDTKRNRIQQNQLLLEVNRLKGLYNNMNVVEMSNTSKLIDKYCDKIKILNDNINNNLENRKKYKNVNIIDIEKQILLLENKKLELDNKVYLLNSDIGLSELDKFKGLDKLGINYYDPNWMQNIDKLLEFFNFGMPDWKSLLPSLIELIPKNPILMWIKSLINILITLITMPLKTLIGIIQSFLNLIKSVIQIPLNPVKIPEWAKNIIQKFNNLIKLITSLPTLKGMLDFLFMSTEGLMLVDIFLPGFASFMESFKKIISDYKDKLKGFVESIKNKKLELNELKNSKLKRKIEIENELKLKKKALSGDDVETSTLLENIKLKNKQDIFKRNIDLLKNTAKDPLLSKESLDIIELELQRNCDVITEIDKLIDNNINELKKLHNKSENELKKEVEDLTNKLNNLDSIYNTDDAQKDINNLNDNANDLEDKIKKLGNFCEWKDNLDVIIKLLREMINLEKEKKNPYDEQIKSKKDNNNKLKDKLKKIENKLNNIDDVNSDKLNNTLNLLNKQINQISENVCNNIEIDNNLSKLKELESLKISLLKEIENKEKINSKTTSELLIDKNLLQNDILKIQKEIKELENKSTDFNIKNDDKLLKLEEIVKYFPVVINIMCCTPKFIVNIFVELLNSIGYMKNLPILWEFPLLE